MTCIRIKMRVLKGRICLSELMKDAVLEDEKWQSNKKFIHILLLLKITENFPHLKGG